MKFSWSGASELAPLLSIGDRVEYRRRGFFSFRPTKWAICLEVQGCSQNNNLSPPRARNVRVVQVSKSGEKMGTYSLEEFLGDGEGRINNPPVVSSEPKESLSSSVKKFFRKVGEFITYNLNRFRRFVGRHRGNIFTVGTAVGLTGITVSIAGLSVTAAFVTGILASVTLLVLYLDPYHKKITLKKPSPKPPISARFTRAPTRYAYSRSKGYRSL